jgi:hypothetical protein
MGPLAATLLSYYEPEKVYSSLVHFHDEYKMHEIFLPGFPGLLEAIYVQERILERMLPAVYASFVCPCSFQSFSLQYLLCFTITEEEHDIEYKLRHEVVYHVILE